MLVKLYPYAVPPDNYTPYKTMCENPGMELTYGRWDNTLPTISHTQNILRGMEKDFSEDKKKAILDTLTVPKHLFCSDPYWLFRYIKIPLLI